MADMMHLLQQQVAERERWLEELHLFTTVAMYDVTPCHKVEMVYVFSETDDNRPSVVSAVHDMHADGIKRIGVPDNLKNPGYSGFLQWGTALMKTGIGASDLFAIEVPGNLNTFSEAQAMVRYAFSHAIASVSVVAPPFHQSRAFLSAISVAVREYPELKIYSRPGVAMDWWCEGISHSQGVLKGTRAEFVSSERERIAKYQKDGNYYPGGDLVSFQQAFRYLCLRDWQ